MGALATHDQIGRVEAEMNKLMAAAGTGLIIQTSFELDRRDQTQGAFYTPKLFVNSDPFTNTARSTRWSRSAQ